MVRNTFGWRGGAPRRQKRLKVVRSSLATGSSEWTGEQKSAAGDGPSGLLASGRNDARDDLFGGRGTDNGCSSEQSKIGARCVTARKRAPQQVLTNQSSTR